MAFVDFMSDAQLPVFVAAHSKHLALGSQKESIEDSALYLFDLVAEVYEDGSCYFFRSVDSKLSVFVGATSENASLTIDKTTVHGSTRKVSDPSLDVDPCRK